MGLRTLDAAADAVVLTGAAIAREPEVLCSRPSASARARNVLAIAGALLAGGLGCASIAGAAVAPADQWGFEQVTGEPTRAAATSTPSTRSRRGPTAVRSCSPPRVRSMGVPAESAPLYTRYLAKRTESGWANRALDAPIDPIPPTSISAVMSVVGTSHDLAYAVVASTRALAPGAVGGRRQRLPPQHGHGQL